MMLKHDEIFCNEAFQNAVYLSQQTTNEIDLRSFIREITRIYKTVGNGPITFSCEPDNNDPDSTERRIILTVSTNDGKIHSYYIHP